MKPLRNDAADYLALRRGLGFKLCRHAIYLEAFLAFMRRKRVRRITTQLALRFATGAARCGPKTRADRLSVVRGFARYRQETDRRTEVPPPGLLPTRRQRAKPYLYSDEEVRRLLKAALARPSLVSLQPWTFHCLFGLLPAERRRAAGRDRAEHPPVMRRQTMLGSVIGQTDTQHLGHGVAGLGGRWARLR